MAGGVMIYLLAYGAVLFSAFTHAPHWHRFFLWPAFFLGTLLLLQAKNRTCVLLAAVKRSQIDGRIQPADSFLSAAALKVSGRILLLSVLYSACITALCFWAL